MSTKGNVARVSESTGSSDDLVIALSRLNDSLDELDGAISLGVDGSTNVRHLAEDRANLARRLDECEARVTSLSSVNSDVSRQLVSVMEKVRGILGG